MWILDESSYRIDKTNFPTREEAEQKAGEAARILGRPISVYTLLKGELIFDFKVLPDGSISQNDPTHDPMKEETVKNPPSTPILGKRHLFDEVAAVLEKAGRPDLASVVDAELSASGEDTFSRNRLKGSVGGAVSLAKELIKAGFSDENGKWFDAIVDHPGMDDPGVQALDKISKGAPTKLAFDKFVTALPRVKAPWKKMLLDFTTKMKNMEFKREFKKFDGQHSQVSELFSIFQQAVHYND